jgi:UrcA family protein
MNASAPAFAAFTAAPPSSIKGALRAAAVAASLVGGAAAAGETAPAVRVQYGDLNLASDAGTRRLLNRLSAAAHRVCDDGPTRELARVARADACYRETLSNAVVAVHDERLTTLYRARTGPGAT